MAREVVTPTNADNACNKITSDPKKALILELLISCTKSSKFDGLFPAIVPVPPTPVFHLSNVKCRARYSALETHVQKVHCTRSRGPTLHYKIHSCTDMRLT